MITMFKMFKIITMSETQYMQYILAMFKMPTIFQMITKFQMLKMFKTPMLFIRHDVQQAQNLQNPQDVQTIRCSNSKMFKRLMMFYKLAMIKAGPVMHLFILPIK